MKRFLTAVSVLVLSCLLLTAADAQTKKKKPCAASLEECPREGCGSRFDPLLNRLKNIKSSSKPVSDSSLNEMIGLEKKAREKVENSEYKKGGPRGALTDLGEGRQIRVVGYLLAVKKEGRESCNCGLSDTDVTTDNHLVIVNPKTVKDFPLPPNATKNRLTAVFNKREPFSVTAEFTPRVRADGHPNFNRRIQLEELNKTPQGALWVRVTGQLMLDTEHFGQKKPARATSWEVHPILKFEFCPQGKTCPKDGDANWVDLDSLP